MTANKMIRITQLLFFLMVIELVIYISRHDNKPIIDLAVNKYALIVTFIAFLASIIIFILMERKKARNE